MYKGKTISNIVEDVDNAPRFVIQFTDGTSLTVSATLDVEDEYNDYNERSVVIGLLLEAKQEKNENKALLFSDHHTWVGRY